MQIWFIEVLRPTLNLRGIIPSAAVPDFIKKRKKAGKMAQWFKMLAAKPDN